ncbi:DUF2164 domain-containing protein [Thalassobacillus sp. CUG 92003]|uniref:DUF2164 domain-containing protein n=1 Tax=Thalassobacillus sp. CUG 92003 TaxID=2736641 RepID=UPI0015E6496B|nr:DUF2164 domain-containing protein [Thalassobacillus sp. CUG 92003]
MVSMRKEEKEHVITNIQTYFELERGEQLGELGADQLLDFFMKELEPYIHNKAVHEARQMVEQKVMNLDEDLLALEKPYNRR